MLFSLLSPPQLKLPFFLRSCNPIKIHADYAGENISVRKENAPENLALLHEFAFNVLKMEKTRKRSLKAKRFKAFLSLDYLEKVLNCLTN
jgi:hypothetical protein